MSKAKTAFVTPFGKYQFEAVPFGLAQAPTNFQQLISFFSQDCSSCAMAYLDDIIIFSKNEQEHLKHIGLIFQKLVTAGLKLKESNCDFCMILLLRLLGTLRLLHSEVYWHTDHWSKPYFTVINVIDCIASINLQLVLLVLAICKVNK